MFYFIKRLCYDAAVWTVGWFGRTKSKTAGIILAALFLPFAFIRILTGKIFGRLEIPYFDFVITTKCSLRCKECSNLMQFYGKTHCGQQLKKAYNIPIESLISDFKKLLDAVDYIQTMTILGGEPFLHSELDMLLIFLSRKKKIGHIQIITNGTIIPKYNVLKQCAKNKKVSVVISDYKAAGVDGSKLVTVLQENKIKYTELISEYWRAYGDFSIRNRTTEELEKVFRGCRVKNCRSFLNGEMHLCPRSSAANDLGIIPCHENDFVNIRTNDTNLNRKNLKKLLWNQKFITACNYCDNSSCFPLKKIVVGEQV